MKTFVFSAALLAVATSAAAQSLPPAPQYYADGRGGLSADPPPLPAGAHWECGWNYGIAHSVCTAVGPASVASVSPYGWQSQAQQTTECHHRTTVFAIQTRNFGYGSRDDSVECK